MSSKYRVIVTCEHAGNMVPVAFKYLFQQADVELMSHRGWDPGALPIAKKLSSELHAPLFFQVVTRLLIEANRSEDNPELFSEYSNGLKRSVKTYILEKYYHSYRDQVINWIKDEIKNYDIVHLSIHSFTPVLKGNKRTTDLGILIDERKQNELNLASRWQTSWSEQLPQYKVDINKPYGGADDGFTTYLRKLFPKNYAGIEFEFNQKFMPMTNDHPILSVVINSLINTFNKDINQPVPLSA